MADAAELRARLDFRKRALKRLRDAYIAIAEGGVKAYMIDDRQLNKLDLPDLLKQIKELEEEVDELESRLDDGAKPRRAFGIVPMNW